MRIPSYLLNFGISATSALALGGCMSIPIDEPRSPGEMNSAYSYIPLDPLPVEMIQGKGCTSLPSNSETLLNALPDNAVRISIRQISAKGDVTLGPAAVGSEGNQYQVVLDYISADTSNIRFKIGISDPSNREHLTPLGTRLQEGTELSVVRVDDPNDSSSPYDVVIPVYVGVGLRLTATVKVIKGSVNLASLGAIAASVEAQRSTGSLVVQTLGINGKQVASSLPLPSELNATTIQNAIQSLGSIKAIMYDSENARITPRVTGIYNPLQTSDPRLINAIVSQLAKSHILWAPPCLGVGRAFASQARQ